MITATGNYGQNIGNGLQLSYTNRRERLPFRNMDCLSARQGHGRQFGQLYGFDPGWTSGAELPAWGVDVRPGYHRLYRVDRVT